MQKKLILLLLIVFEQTVYSQDSLNILIPRHVINDTLEIKSIELNQVIVKDRFLTDASKIEYRVVKPKEPEAPITKNFIKNLPGVNKFKEEFKYLNRSILYYLDGIKAEEKSLSETLTNSLDKVEIHVTPTSQFWMKPGEVIFNFISKKSKIPKSGLNLNATEGLLIPYHYGSLNYYYLDKKFNFRISSLLYTHKNFENYVDNKRFNNLISTTKNEGNNQVTPNFNNFVFNYFIDSTTTISFQHLNNFIQSNNHSNFSFQLFSDPTYLIGVNNSTFSKKELDNWLTFQKKSNIINANYRFSTSIRNVLFQSEELNKQQIEDKNEQFNLNYSNTFALKGGSLSYNVSYEKLFSESDFTDYLHIKGGSVFNSQFWALKSNFQKSFKNLNLNLGFRVDLINQQVETKPASEAFKINKLVFLPTLSLNLSTDKYGDFILSFNQDYSIPEISRLSKFSKQLNPFEILQGNNQLQNENKSETGLSHYYANEKVNLSSSITYEAIANYLGYGPYVSANNLFFQTYSNIGNYKNLSFNSSLSLQLSGKISNQFSVNHSINNYRLKDALYFFGFDVNWNSKTTLSNSIYFTVSKRLETNLDLSYTNFEYAFFKKNSFKYPSVSINFDINVGKEWYYSIFLNTIFTNSNLSSEYTIQPNFSSSLTMFQKNSNIEISIRKIFGNKKGQIMTPKSRFDGIQHQVKKE